MVDYQNELRQGLFETLTGILQGLRNDQVRRREAHAPLARSAFINPTAPSPTTSPHHLISHTSGPNTQAGGSIPTVRATRSFVHPQDTIFKDTARSDDVTRGAVGVLGYANSPSPLSSLLLPLSPLSSLRLSNMLCSDLAHSLGSKVKPLLVQDAVKQIVKQCSRSDSEVTQDVAAWAQEVITLSLPSSPSPLANSP